MLCVSPGPWKLIGNQYTQVTVTVAILTQSNPVPVGFLPSPAPHKSRDWISSKKPGHLLLCLPASSFGSGPSQPEDVLGFRYWCHLKSFSSLLDRTCQPKTKLPFHATPLLNLPPSLSRQRPGLWIWTPCSSRQGLLSL